MALENPLLKNVESGQLIEIFKSPFTLGRSLSSDFVIESKIVSRIHCSFEKNDEGWALRDSSTNGTMVNDEIYKSVLSPILKNDDEICLGFAQYTYKFLLQKERAPNSQVERLKFKECFYSPANESLDSALSPNSRTSFDENGISDDVLNNLADNLLRESQKDVENILENNENQPSTSLKEQKVQASTKEQDNLPTFSEQAQQNLVNNSEQNNGSEENSIELLLKPTQSSTSTVINSDTTSKKETQIPVPINIKSSEVIQPSPCSTSTDIISNDAIAVVSSPTEVISNETIQPSTSCTAINSNESEQPSNHLMYFANTPESSNSSTSTIIYSLPNEPSKDVIVDNNDQDIAPSNNLPTLSMDTNSNTHKPKPVIIDVKILNKNLTGNAFKASESNSNKQSRKSIVLRVKNTATKNTPGSSGLANSNNSYLSFQQIPSSTSFTSSANTNKRIRVMSLPVQASTSSTMPRSSVGIQQIQTRGQNSIITCPTGYITYQSTVNGRLAQIIRPTLTSTNLVISPYNLINSGQSSATIPKVNITSSSIMSTAASGNNSIEYTDVQAEVSSAFLNNQNNNGSNSLDTVTAVGDGGVPTLKILDSQSLPVADHVEVEYTTIEDMGDVVQNTEAKNAKEKSPPKKSHNSQTAGTSKDCQKSEKTEPAKQSNQGLDQNQYEEMENELMCTICANLFIKAVTLGCSHSFCQYCIETWKKKKSVCPICRNTILSTIRTLVLDNIIEKMMENASEEDKKARQQAVDERKKIEDAEIAAKTKANNKRNNTRGRRGNNRNRRGNGRNNQQVPMPIQLHQTPVQQPVQSYPTVEIPDSPTTTETESNSDDNDRHQFDYDEYYDDDWYGSDYNGRSGVYYGGYGRCYSCGERGHWANGCPYR